MRFSLMSYILPICHSVFEHQSNMFWEIESKRMAEYETDGWRAEDEKPAVLDGFFVHLMCSLNDFSSLIWVARVRARLPFIAILHSPYFHNINKNRLVDK